MKVLSIYKSFYKGLANTCVSSHTVAQSGGSAKEFLSGGLAGVSTQCIIRLCVCYIRVYVILAF